LELCEAVNEQQQDALAQNNTSTAVLIVQKSEALNLFHSIPSRVLLKKISCRQQ
jgi:hypothetical protein